MDVTTAMPVSIMAARELLTRPGSLFETQEVIILGREMRIWRNAPPSLRSLFESSRSFGDRTYLVYEDERLTYRTHTEKVCRFANTLVYRYGVRKGDRVAIAMRNLPEWPIVFWATTAIGAIAVPLNAWWSGPELQYAIEDSGSSVLVLDGERLDRLRGSLGELALRGVMASRHAKPEDSGIDDLNAIIQAAPSATELPPAHIDPDDEATIFYTSGTTAKPKGVLGTHRNLISNVFNYLYMTAFGDLRRGLVPRVLCGPPTEPTTALLCVPLFHVTGCHSTLAINTFLGYTTVLMHKWDPERALQLIERERVNSFGGIPTVIWQITETAGFKSANTSSIKSLFYGGALSGPEIVSRIESAFPGAQPSTGYGMTEVSSIATAIAGVDYQRKPQSVGLPTPVVDIRIVSTDGRDLPAYQEGEIWIKGPNVMKGYWRRPEATEETITNGWIRSGDLGYMDEDGFVYLGGRIKELIIRGGENISAAEVERALFSHEAVMEAAVFGVPDRLLGEEVAAVVRIRPGLKATAGDLRAFLSSRIAGYKVPALMEIRNEPMPRNAAGKILKGDLKKSFAGIRIANKSV